MSDTEIGKLIDGVSEWSFLFSRSEEIFLVAFAPDGRCCRLALSRPRDPDDLLGIVRAHRGIFPTEYAYRGYSHDDVIYFQDELERICLSLLRLP